MDVPTEHIPIGDIEAGITHSSADHHDLQGNDLKPNHQDRADLLAREGIHLKDGPWEGPEQDNKGDW